MLAALAEVFRPIAMIFSWFQRTACTSKIQVLWAGIDIFSVREKCPKLYYFVTAASTTPHCVQLGRWEHSIFLNAFRFWEVLLGLWWKPKCLLLYFLDLDASLSSDESFRLLLILSPPSSEAKPVWSCMFNYASLLLWWQGFFTLANKKQATGSACGNGNMSSLLFMSGGFSSDGDHAEITRQASSREKSERGHACVSAAPSPSNRHEAD